MKNKQLPKIYRFISEPFKFSLPKLNRGIFFRSYSGSLKVFVMFIFIFAVVIVGLDFKKNIETKQDVDRQRDSLTKELKFWEDFITKHHDYRDAYFQASILEYKLGNVSSAESYVKKGLFLDPNSENGKKLQKFFESR